MVVRDWRSFREEFFCTDPACTDFIGRPPTRVGVVG